MKPFTEQLAAYRQQHTQKTNQIAHYIGIPAILIGALLALNWVSISIAKEWHITFAWLLTIGLLVYYYFLDVKLASAMAVVLVILTLICAWIAFPAPGKFSLILFLILFIGGWVLQFIGHSFEKVKPDFSNILQAVVTPMFILAEFMTMLGIGKYFDLEEAKSDDNNQPPPSEGN